MNDQPNLFDQNETNESSENIVLFALGDFQSRGKVLVDRELPLERLLGAFRRASAHFEVEKLSDQRLAKVLKSLGAKIVEIPDFVAKHPFRVTVSTALGARASDYYEKTLKTRKLK